MEDIDIDKKTKFPILVYAKIKRKGICIGDKIPIYTCGEYDYYERDG